VHLIARIACLLLLFLLPAQVLPAQAQDTPSQDGSSQKQNTPSQDTPAQNAPSQDAPSQNAPANPNQASPDQPKQDNQERVEIDTNLICDTPEQVERFVSLLNENKGSAEAAMAGVNQESKSHDACVIATAAYRRAGVTNIVKTGDTTFDVTRIVVIGVYTVNGLERSLPTEFFTLFPRDGTSSGTVGQGQQ
jgi:hypothetical protein